MKLKSSEISKLFRDIGNKSTEFKEGIKRVQESMQRVSKKIQSNAFLLRNEIYSIADKNSSCY